MAIGATKGDDTCRRAPPQSIFPLSEILKLRPCQWRFCLEEEWDGVEEYLLWEGEEEGGQEDEHPGGAQPTQCQSGRKRDRYIDR